MKKKPLSTPKSSGPDAAALDRQASAKFNAGQYKEAIELYKTLLKHENKAAWQTALAQCYLQRALAFADKGMVKEAVVLWENYAQNTQPPHEARDHYISWLLQTNDLAKVSPCLKQLSAPQLDGQHPELASLLGLLIISGKLSCQDQLPQDSVFINHLSAAQAALNAFKNNLLDDVDPILQKLPFRSAFRDFRTLLKATLLMPGSAGQARALLAKIPANSPYRQASAMLLAMTHDGAALVNSLWQFTPPQIKAIEASQHFNKKQTELLDVLIKQKNNLSDKLKFNLAIQYQPLFGADLAQSYCHAALLNYPAGQRDYNKQFGAISEFEGWRLKALTCERDESFHDAEYYWKQGIAALKTQDAQADFKIALIMRHLAAHQDNPEETVTWLINSLDHDPDDRDSYAKILKCYEQEEQQTDAYKEWLDKSIKKYPNDVELLGLAIKAATRNKAFKKASQYAKALLKIDPVNTAAKQVLFASHLAHARKLIKTKKFHLVENEILQAESIALGKRHQARAQLVRGLFAWLTEDKKRGEQLITEALQKYKGDAFNTHFYLMMEALLLNVALTAPLLKILPPPAKAYVLSEPEIIQLAQLIQQYADDDQAHQPLLHKALEKVKATIKQSFKQNISEAALLTLCSCLARIQHFELLRALGKTNQPLWHRPIGVYYRVYAEANGKPAKCSDINSYRLEDSLNEARTQKDHKAATLIGKLLEQYYQSIRPDFGFLDALFGGGADDDEAMLDELFGHLPDKLYDQLSKQTLQIMAKNSPERIIKNLATQYLGNDLKLMAEVFNAPDALHAFLILKAADDLGIDIEVSAEEIIECFNSQKTRPKSKPKPFPFF